MIAEQKYIGITTLNKWRNFSNENEEVIDLIKQIKIYCVDKEINCQEIIVSDNLNTEIWIEISLRKIKFKNEDFINMEKIEDLLKLTNFSDYRLALSNSNLLLILKKY